MCVSEAVCLLGGDWELGVVGRQGRGEEVRMKEGLRRVREGEGGKGDDTHMHTNFIKTTETHICCRHAFLSWIHQELAQQIQCLQQISSRLTPHSMNTQLSVLHCHPIQ